MTFHEPLHFTGVVAAAGERRADHLEEAQLLFADFSELIKLSGCHEAVDGQVLGSR